MALFYAEHNVETIIIIGQDNYQNPSTVQFAKSYQSQYDFTDPILAVNDPNFTKISKAVAHWSSGGPGIPHFIVVDHQMEIHWTDTGIEGAAAALAKITGVAYPFQ